MNKPPVGPEGLGRLAVALLRYGQLAFTPASPSGHVPRADDCAWANTHAADVPESFGPAMPGWSV